MPNEAFTWMGRIKAVEREFRAIRLGADLLLTAVNNDPSILKGQVTRPDIGTASAHLEGTYIVRVFSEFETALQHFIRAFHIRRPNGAEALVNRVRDRGASLRVTRTLFIECASIETCWYTNAYGRPRR